MDTFKLEIDQQPETKLENTKNLSMTKSDVRNFANKTANFYVNTKYNLQIKARYVRVPHKCKHTWVDASGPGFPWRHKGF